mgnify:FL=1
MIDIENAKKVFDEYVSNYDPTVGRIKLKIEHIKRVAENIKNIALEQDLDSEQIKLAEIIGLLHDIGRFEQVRLYDTFSDKISVNHGEYGVKVLFKDGLINKFKLSEKDKEIVKLAILNHNRDKIQEGLDDEQLLYAKMIRDADKLDIYYTMCKYDFKDTFWYPDFDCEEISDLIMNEFKNDKKVNYADIKNNADVIVIFYAYVYDLYFETTKNILKEKNYLEKFTEKVCKNFKSEKIHTQVKEILEISSGQ